MTDRTRSVVPDAPAISRPVPDSLVVGVGGESLAVRVEWLAEAGRVLEAVEILERHGSCGVPRWA
jgi:hypothetical protein